MRRKLNFLPIFLAALLFYSCDDEKIDTPQISSYSVVESAYMADSVPFDVTIDANYPMNSIRILFFLNDEKVSESIIPVNKAGIYGKKLYVPYTKDISDGRAEIQIIAKNKNFDYSTKSVFINIGRPKYPFLTLKTAYGDYKMEPVSGEPYKYAVTSDFPTNALNAIIEAPSYGENGNSFYFGGKTITANTTNTDSIPFLTDLSPGSEYTVSFDTRTFEGEPFLKPSFDGIEFPAFVSNMAIVEKEFSQNQQLSIRGFLDLEDWWIDPTFLDINPNGTYKFRAANGKYRITADQNLKYFRIEPMSGNNLADFDPITKTGSIWVNGGIGDQPGSAPAERLGVPSMTANGCLWNPAKNFAMASMGSGIYQVKLIANKTLFLCNVSGSTVGIAFYQNSRSMDNPVSLDLVQSLYGSPGSEGPGGSGTLPNYNGLSARFQLMATPNTYSKGNYIAGGSNRSLGNGRTYVFTLDTNYSPVKLSISLE